MAWETSNRRSRLPRDWEARRRIVIARDNGRCQAVVGGVHCAAEGTEVDHIDAGDNHNLTNLQLLCKACHAWKTRGEATAGLLARQRKAKIKPLNERWR
nr:MAG TPA: HNH endonuclease [Caudoviricetes sp.]